MKLPDILEGMENGIDIIHGLVEGSSDQGKKRFAKRSPFLLMTEMIENIEFESDNVGFMMKNRFRVMITLNSQMFPDSSAITLFDVDLSKPQDFLRGIIDSVFK